MIDLSIQFGNKLLACFVSPDIIQGRIYFKQAPQNEENIISTSYPFIVYDRISSTSRRIEFKAELYEFLFQVTAYSLLYDELEEIVSLITGDGEGETGLDNSAITIAGFDSSKLVRKNVQLLQVDSIWQAAITYYVDLRKQFKEI